MPCRYVVLWHSDIDEPHYDLMFETSPGSSLATWRSPVWPIVQETPLLKLRDHRAAFLNFQGSLSQDRGSVTQVESGNCEIEIENLMHWIFSIANGSLSLRLLEDDRWEGRPLENPPR